MIPAGPANAMQASRAREQLPSPINSLPEECKNLLNAFLPSGWRNNKTKRSRRFNPFRVIPYPAFSSEENEMEIKF